MAGDFKFSDQTQKRERRERLHSSHLVRHRHCSKQHPFRFRDAQREDKDLHEHQRAIIEQALFLPRCVLLTICMWASKTRRRRGRIEEDRLPLPLSLPDDDKHDDGGRRTVGFAGRKGTIVSLLLILCCCVGFFSQNNRGARIINPQPTKLFEPLVFPDLTHLPPERIDRIHKVQDAIKHAWKSYSSVCIPGRGSEVVRNNNKNIFTRHIPMDDLSPIKMAGEDWLYHAATLHDSLDTLALAGLTDEYNAAVNLILQQDISATSLLPTKTFEYSLRIVGGLLGAFSVTGDLRLLSRARDATDALLQSPFYSSPTVLPRMYDVLFPPLGSSIGRLFYKMYSRVYQWGRDAFTNEHHINSLAGVGSFALEFYFLSQVLGVDEYKQRADDIFVHVSSHRRDDGIVPSMWNVMSGLPISTYGGMGSGSDSFYEYLLKVYIASCHKMSDETIYYDQICGNDSDAGKMLQLYKQVVDGALRSHHMYTPPHGKTLPISYPVDGSDEFHHLLCFLPGLLALGAHNIEERYDDLLLAEELIKGCDNLYKQSPTGLGPESIHIGDLNRKGHPVRGDLSYRLRPEYVESLFVLYRVTGNEMYQEMGWEFFTSLEKHCRINSGYTGLKNVYDSENGGGRIDDMPSYFIAETLKYLLLLFSPGDYVSLDDFVFTTEAHPLRRKANLKRKSLDEITEESDFVVPTPVPWPLSCVFLAIAGIVLLVNWHCSVLFSRRFVLGVGKAKY